MYALLKRISDTFRNDCIFDFAFIKYKCLYKYNNTYNLSTILFWKKIQI